MTSLVLFSLVLVALAVGAGALPHISIRALHEIGAADHSPMHGKIIYLSFAMTAFVVVFWCFATRAKALNLHNIRRMNLIKFIVFIIYILGLGFISSAAILQFGLGLSTTTRCRSAILMCLVFYVGGKVCVYLFLVERIHAIRATVYKRFKDWAWVTSMLVVVLGFGAIAVVAFLKPLFELSERDGKCRIGLPSKLLAGLLAYDVGVNIAMTVWFFMLVRPYLVSGLPNVIPTFVQKGCKKIRVLINKQTKTACTTSGADTACSSIVRLMSKSFIGSVGVLITTIINLSVLLHMQGREQAWLCFSLCTTDIICNVLIIHYLTSSAEDMASATKVNTSTVPSDSSVDDGTYELRHAC